MIISRNDGAFANSRCSLRTRPKHSTTIGQKTEVSSLFDMSEMSFKMMMMKRLGTDDYNKIFKSPRIEYEIE